MKDLDSCTLPLQPRQDLASHVLENVFNISGWNKKKLLQSWVRQVSMQSPRNPGGMRGNILAFTSQWPANGFSPVSRQPSANLLSHVKAHPSEIHVSKLIFFWNSIPQLPGCSTPGRWFSSMPWWWGGVHHLDHDRQPSEHASASLPWWGNNACGHPKKKTAGWEWGRGFNISLKKSIFPTRNKSISK